MLRWTRLQMKGVAHIGDIDVPGCSVLALKGPNGVGKTLFLKMVKRFFYKENDPGIIADGHDEAVGRMELTDGDTTMTIVRRQTKTDAPAKVTYSDGRSIDSSIETRLKEVISSFGMDPLSIMDADKDKREEFLRDVLPIKFSGAEVAAITGIKIAAGEMDLATFDSHVSGAEQRRKELGANKRALEGAVKSNIEILCESPDEVDYEKLGAAEQQKLSGLERERDTAKQAARDKHADREKQTNRILSEEELENATAKQAARDRYTAREREITRELEERIAVLRAAAAVDVSAAAMDRDHEIARIDEVIRGNQLAGSAAVAKSIERRDEEIASIDAKYASQISEQTQVLGAVRAKAADQMRQAGARENARKQKADLDELAAKASNAQRIVEKLHEYRSKKLAELPIPGVTYKKGAIFVDGKDLDTECNTALQYQVVMQLASLAFAQGGFAFMVTDRWESLDFKRRKWFVEAAENYGIQVMVTEVVPDAEALTIERVA